MDIEYAYRRMCEAEAEATLVRGGLDLTRSQITASGIRHTSNGNKWITRNPRNAAAHTPKGTEPGTHIAVMRLAPGTLESLVLLAGEHEILKSGRGNYGIPAKYLDWFNSHIDSLSVQDAGFPLPAPESVEGAHKYLESDGNIMLFQAFSPRYIDGARFSDELHHHRMTWVKTSLLWMLYRAKWGNEEGQERIISISAPQEYIRQLETASVPTSSQEARNAPIIVQADPDRKILGVRWVANQDNYWVRTGSTLHFGLRKEGLEEFEALAAGRISDITETIREIERARPAHPTTELYKRLGYNRVILTEK